MKKIGIITLNGYFNYGNRLQNFALQEILKSYNFEVETLWIKRSQTKKRENVLKRFLKVFLKPVNVAQRTKKILFPDKNKAKRIKRFKEFSNQYINESNYIISEQNLHEDILNTFDFFVTGSDQVWNPFYIKGSSLFFLTFAPIEKRISYAASFGVSEIPKEHVENYKKWLSEMENISVREQDGVDIVKRLTNRNVPELIDPTLLISREDWLTITKEAKNKPKKEILLTYFLGKIPKSTQKIINKYKREYKLTIVNLANPKYKKHYLTDPAEFLDYIYSARLFFTDSFHGALFSILFETPFIVTNRKSKTPSMNSRIETLLTKFNLKSRHIDNFDDKDIMNVDFSHTSEVLKNERRRAFKYLRNSLKKQR